MIIFFVPCFACYHEKNFEKLRKRGRKQWRQHFSFSKNGMLWAYQYNIDLCGNWESKDQKWRRWYRKWFWKKRSIFRPPLSHPHWEAFSHSPSEGWTPCWPSWYSYQVFNTGEEAALAAHSFWNKKGSPSPREAQRGSGLASRSLCIFTLENVDRSAQRRERQIQTQGILLGGLGEPWPMLQYSLIVILA